jgi:integrase
MDPHEIKNLLSQLDPPYRQMVLLDATTRLRRSESLALKWGDIDFENQTMTVSRSIYGQVSGIARPQPRGNLFRWLLM